MRGRTILMAAVMALGVLAVSCSSADAELSVDDAADVEASEQVESNEDEPSDYEGAESGEESEAEPDEEEQIAEDETDEQASEPIELDFEFSPLEPGTYAVNTTGVPFTVEVARADEWFVQPNSDAWTVFSHPASQGPDDRDVVFLRPSMLSDPSQPGAAVEDQVGLPVDDLAGWIDNLIDGVITEAPVETELGGRNAVRFEAEVSDQSVCGDQGFCVGFATNNLINNLQFSVGVRSVVYWVDMGEHPPLAVYIGSDADDENWVTTAEEFLETLEFGEPGPHPIDSEAGPLWEQGLSSDVPAGQQQFPVLGGLQLDLDQERYVVNLGDNFLVVTDGPIAADVEIWKADSTLDGTPITSTEDLIAALEPQVRSLEEVATSTRPLGEAREFDLLGPTTRPGPEDGIRTEEGGAEWISPMAGYLWVFETERGVVVVSAESFEGDAFVEQMVMLAEDVVLPGVQLIDFE